MSDEIEYVDPYIALDSETPAHLSSLLVTPELFVAMCVEGRGAAKCVTGLPEGCVVGRRFYDELRAIFVIVIKHGSFPMVQAGGRIQIHTAPTFEALP